MIAVIAVLAIFAGILSSALAVQLYVRLVNSRRGARFELENIAGRMAFRELLLTAQGVKAVVLASEDTEFPGSGEANALLKAALNGPDSRQVAVALTVLQQEGTAFDLVARRNESGETIAITGKTVAGRAIAFAKASKDNSAANDCSAVLDIVPAAIWVRGSNLALRWSNRTFREATNLGGLREVLASNASQDRPELDLASAALEGAQTVESIRYALVKGQRRAFSLHHVRLPDASVAGIAIDVTEKMQAEGALRRHIEATIDVLEGLPFAVAVFGKDQRLESCNSAYARMWALAGEWLETHPTLGDILDRLRETRKLMEQPDYAAWKAGQLSQFEENAQQHEEFWHTAGGHSLHVTTRPHLLGGLVVMVEDISEKLHLEASFNLLLQVQRATLDTVEDGIAVFGPDGRLALFNSNFAKLWRFGEDELCAQPHFAKLANLAEARLGHDGIWRILSAGVMSPEPERCNDWGRVTRADGRVMSLSMLRLPNGATVATFCDLTDVERFRGLQSEKPHAA